MSKNKWTVLLVGGSSGIGKTQLTKELAKIYDTKIIEADDISCAAKALTTAETHPALHYWISDIDWRTAGVHGNVEWLSRVSDELSLALKAIVDIHVEEASPVIIEGDFISPELAASFDTSEVKSIYVYESDHAQIVDNYLQREGGALQEFRASISAKYGDKLKTTCQEYNLNIVESRPWDSLISRAIESIEK